MTDKKAKKRLGTLASHEMFYLLLLPSGPDTFIVFRCARPSHMNDNTDKLLCQCKIFVNFYHFYFNTSRVFSSSNCFVYKV